MKLDKKYKRWVDSLHAEQKAIAPCAGALIEIWSSESIKLGNY